MPFDPSRVGRRAGAERPGDSEDGGESGRPLSVSQLAVRLDQAIRSGVPGPVRVAGEISGLRERTHLYFNLKDAGAVVGAVMFASAARRCGVALADGMAVVARGRVEYYAQQGRVSLIVDRVEPVGRGALEAQLRALVEELRGLGWLEEGRKRPLPVLPRRVAVVTSRSGAALQDVIDTARRRCPAVGLAVVDVRVQGERAAAEVARAIEWVGSRHAELALDAILVTRGGGSMEDLWAFNDRAVARAIVHSPVPVVAAIGHETDTTIAELVADVRAATPTQAAMRLVPDRLDLARQVESLMNAARSALRRRLGTASERLRGLSRRPAIARPGSIVQRRAQWVAGAGVSLSRVMRSGLDARHRELDRLWARLERHRPAALHAARVEHTAQLAARLGRVIWRRLAETGRDLDALERELSVVGPGAVLGRGYAVLTDEAGLLIRSVRGARPGGAITARVSDGSFAAIVGGATDAGPIGAALPGRRRRRSAPHRGTQLGPGASAQGPGDRGSDQLGLFGGGG